MSRTNQKPSTKIEDVLVPRQFDLRLWDTWEAPSLILLLDHKERRILRETFDIHWEDLDIHIRLVDECCGTGVAREQRVRRDKNVKLVYELNKVPDGIQVLLYIQAMTVGIEKPLLDDNGYPRKLTFERMYPEDRIADLFNKANAFMKGMEAFRIAYWAKLDGNEKVFAQLGNAIDFARDGLNGADTAGLTATVEEVVSHDAKKPKGEKKAKPRAVKIETASTEAAPVEASDDVARKLTVSLGLEDPGSGVIDVEAGKPVPVASASPTPAPKPKKEKPKAIKLGSPEAAAKLVELGATAAPSNGSNGQSS